MLSVASLQHSGLTLGSATNLPFIFLGLWPIQFSIVEVKWKMSIRVGDLSDSAKQILSRHDNQSSASVLITASEHEFVLYIRFTPSNFKTLKCWLKLLPSVAFQRSCTIGFGYLGNVGRPQVLNQSSYVPYDLESVGNEYSSVLGDREERN